MNICSKLKEVMPRPRKYRMIQSEFGISFFGPKGVPMRELELVSLTHEEVEALRLADLEGFYQEEAAQAMGVSRATFGRVLDSARRKLVDALINGKGIQVKGGAYSIADRPVTCRYWRGRRGWRGGRG
ncbi:MAG: DUF134 domain-containing protein [candidate division WOR-3 bacterium]|nr:DUF134 domain-containing protein [candidate division WOR-3 bacterium]